MPATLVNSVSGAAGVALLLSPEDPVERKLADSTNAAPASVHLLGEWNGRRSGWSEQGWDFTVQYIGEISGNVSGGIKRGTVFNGLLNVGATVDLEKAVGWKGAAFQGTMLFPQGRSLTDSYVGDVFRLSNLDAVQNAHLFELWVEQKWGGEKFSVRAGQLAVDQEFGYTEQGALFRNSTFGWFPIVGATAPVYPQGAPGVRLAWHPTEQFFWQAAIVDGDVNPVDVRSRETNPHGTRVKLDEGALLMSEAGINWHCGHDCAGSAKFGAWYHTDDHGSLRFDDGGLSLADPLSSGNAKKLAGDWGIYVAAEQTLWRENAADKNDGQGLGAFFRAGYEPDDRNFLQYYLEGGVTRTGWLPHRDDDVCGIAVAFGGVGGEASGFVRDQNFFTGSHLAVPDHECVIECDYQARVCRGVKLQPGAQYIIHPGGSSATADALVLGLRAVIDF